MSDSHNPNTSNETPCYWCGGDGSGGSGRPIVPQPSFTSPGSPWPFSSTTLPSLTDTVSSNHEPLPSCVGYACTSESTTEPSHRCDPNSHQDRRLHFLDHPLHPLHPPQRQRQRQRQQHLHHNRQFDLSTGLASPRAATPLFSAARDTPPSNEDHHHRGVSAQQQGIASSPVAAAAIADQDFPFFASTLPNSWNSSPSPTPSFGSLSNTHSSNLSSETEFGGGAPIASEDIDGTLRNNRLSPRTGFNNNKSPETPGIDESDEGGLDGGIYLSASETTSSGPVEVFYPSSALHATVMDEDEDDFSPNNLITRPPSPVGSGSSFIMDIFSSPSYESQNLLESGSGDFSALPSFHMQLSPPLDDINSQPNVQETSPPLVALLDTHLQPPSALSTPAETVIDSSSPDAQFPISRGTDGLEIVTGGDEELLVVESELNNSSGLQENIENYNKDFANFCLHAYCRYRLNPTKFPKFLPAAADVKNTLSRPGEVMRAEMEERGWDYQAIPWDDLGISSEVARGIRRKEYTNYENIKGLTYDKNPVRVPANRNFFKFRRMDNEQRCRLIHFQLRNLLGVVSRNDVFYAGDALVMHTNPLTGKSRTMMDLRAPDSWSGNPIRISTLGTCGGSNGIVIAGCFYGEFAMKPLHAPADAPPITGIVTHDESGITNHVQMIKNRTTGTPNAVFSSNDHFIRVLNCGEGMRFINEHEYKWAVNCSATSPDSRLRVVVGDDTEILICDAERGTTEFVLEGHRDYGFAAAWSDDEYTIATGNQDKTVRIFDARNLSKTVKVLPAVMAGVRTLRFSPIGYGGKRVLAMAEPADVVQIVDAVSWDSLQQIDFWGEVGGIDFDSSGEEFYIANADKSVGGIMEFSRTKGSVYYEDYSREKAQQHRSAEKGARRRRRKRGAFVTSSDDDSESTAFSDEEPVEDDDDIRKQLDTRKRGRYYDSRRYKRLGHDMGSVFV